MYIYIYIYIHIYVYTHTHTHKTLDGPLFFHQQALTLARQNGYDHGLNFIQYFPRRDSNTKRRLRENRATIHIKTIMHIVSPCFLEVSSWVWSLFWGIYERLAEYGWKPHRDSLAPKSLSRALIYWYMCSNQRGTASSNSRFQTVLVLFQQYSADLSI